MPEQQKKTAVRMKDADRPPDVKVAPPEGFDPKKPHTWPFNPTDPAGVRPGDLLMMTSYAVVADVRTKTGAFADDVVDHALSAGDRDVVQHYNLAGDSLISRAASADQYDPSAVVALSQTALIDVLLNARSLPFTVAWTKKDGEPRVLRGRLALGDGFDESLVKGYIRVEDLDKDHPKTNGARFRTVTSLTIEWLIICGVKYVAK